MNLQAQFPLNTKKKFQKKILVKLPFMLILAVAAGFLPFVVKIVANPDIPNSLFSISGIATLLIVFIAEYLIFAWYVRVYIRTYYYSADENFLTIKKGAITPAEIHVQYQKIQDVYVDQDILDRLFGVYDVHIASATVSSGIEAHIDGVNKDVAEGLKKFLLESIKNGSSSQGSTTTQPVATTVVPEVVFKEEISSTIYPLSKKWFWVTLVTQIIVALVTGTIFLLYIVGNGFGWVLPLLFLYYIGVLIWIPISLNLWKKNYSFSFKEGYIYYKEGVLSLSEKHMPYSSIQDAVISQPFIERIFGLGRVQISDATQQVVVRPRRGESAPSGIVLQGFTVSDANTIADLIKTHILSNKRQGMNGL